MGFLDRVVAGAEYRAATSGLRSPAAWLTDAFAGGSTSTAGQSVTPRKSIQSIAVFAAVNKISEAVGTLPFKVYRNLDDGSRTEARTSRVWRIVHDKPNSLTPANRFWSTVTAQILLWGNAFLRKQRDPLTGLVIGLWLIDPSRVTVQVDENQERKRFIVTPANIGPQVTYSDDDVVHIMGVSLDGLVGLSRIAECRNAVGTALARDEWEGNFYRRGATVSGVLQHPRNLTTDASKRLKDNWQTIYGGSRGAHQVAVLEEGMTFERVSMPLRDLQFVESQQLSRSEIAILFGLPPSKLGGSTGDSLTYGNREQDAIEYAQETLLPLTTTIAKALAVDSGLFPQSIFEPEFVFEGLLRADSAARAEFYEKAISNGWMLKNEARVLENMPEIDGLDAKPQPAIPPPADNQQNGNGGAGVDAVVAALTQGQ